MQEKLILDAELVSGVMFFEIHPLAKAGFSLYSSKYFEIRD
jgi:hypothetical protein